MQRRIVKLPPIDTFVTGRQKPKNVVLETSDREADDAAPTGSKQAIADDDDDVDMDLDEDSPMDEVSDASRSR